MRRIAAVDPANLCTHCPHEVIGYPNGVYWCPCEDCHRGGLIQGREPKDNHTVAPSPVASSDETFVDPIHQL